MATWVTLCENKAFRTLYYRGKSLVHPALVTYVRKNSLGYPRVGITTGKKIGCAVKRSRCRRVIRAAFQGLYPRVGSYDIVFVARVRTGEYTSTRLAEAMEKQLRQLGVLTDG